MKTILITGGTGLLGQALTTFFENHGYTVRILTRSPKKSNEFAWDIQHQKVDKAAFDKLDVLVHLAGAGIADKRWSEQRKKEIISSRTASTGLLVETVKELQTKPKLVIAASATGFYGAKTSGKIHVESEEPSADFLGETVKLWEEATNAFRDLGIRTVQYRIGIVLARQGGALKEMTKPPVLTPLGSGKQYIPFVHIEDIQRLFLYAVDNENLNDVYNAVADEHITNAQFTRALAKTSGKPFLPIHAPDFALKLVLGEMAKLVLTGDRVSNEKIKKTGFHFAYPTANEALTQLFSS